MSQENASPSIRPMMLTFLAGAAFGAVVAALTTPKSGAELRGDLKDFGGKAKRKAGDLANDAWEVWEDMKGRTSLAAADLKRGMADAANDLRG